MVAATAIGIKPILIARSMVTTTNVFIFPIIKSVGTKIRTETTIITKRKSIKKFTRPKPGTTIFAPTVYRKNGKPRRLPQSPPASSSTSPMRNGRH